MSDSRFAFALCQPGTERWLKAEVARLRPDLRPAFGRPGLVTFKCTGAAFRPDERPATTFGRAWGCAAGPGADPVEVAGRVGARSAWVAARDAGVPGEIPPARQAAFDASARALELPALAAAPAAGDLVVDVLTAPDEPPFVGWHRHGPAFPGPGGRLALEVPEDLPSRAWRKVVESLAWSRLPVRSGETVLEIGAAPGGGTRAFAERGLRVVAVDRNPMDPQVLALPGVTWVRRWIGDVAEPPAAEWVACDADLAPEQALAALTRVIRLHRPRGLLWTVKLVRPEVAESLPGLREQIRSLGAKRVDSAQLAAHRRDLVLAATW